MNSKRDSDAGAIVVMVAMLIFYAAGIVGAIKSDSLGLTLACIFLPPVTLIYGLIYLLQSAGS